MVSVYLPQIDQTLSAEQFVRLARGDRYLEGYVTSRMVGYRKTLIEPGVTQFGAYYDSRTGWSIYTQQAIQKDTVVMAYGGQKMKQHKASFSPRGLSLDNTYVVTADKVHTRFSASSFSNLAAYIQHAPTTLARYAFFSGELETVLTANLHVEHALGGAVLVASRDIQPGEFLGYDYCAGEAHYWAGLCQEPALLWRTVEHVQTQQGAIVPVDQYNFAPGFHPYFVSQPYFTSESGNALDQAGMSPNPCQWVLPTDVPGQVVHIQVARLKLCLLNDEPYSERCSFTAREWLAQQALPNNYEKLMCNG